MIVFTQAHIHEIEGHGESTYPNECGGMLLGRFAPGGDRTVVETYPLLNSSLEDQSNRVLLLPRDVMRTERYAREKELDVIGYYHSHPDHPAVPSQYDLDHALPIWSYVIVSVKKGKAADIRSWIMENDRSKFEEEERQIADQASALI